MKTILWTAGKIGVTIAIIIFLFARVDLAVMARHLARANMLLLLLALALYFLAIVLGALKWQVLVRAQNLSMPLGDLLAVAFGQAAGGNQVLAVLFPLCEVFQYLDGFFTGRFNKATRVDDQEIGPRWLFNRLIPRLLEQGSHRFGIGADAAARRRLAPARAIGRGDQDPNAGGGTRHASAGCLPPGAADGRGRQGQHGE